MISLHKARYPIHSKHSNTHTHTCTFQLVSISWSQQESADSSVDDVISVSASSHGVHIHLPHLWTMGNRKLLFCLQQGSDGGGQRQQLLM